MLMNRSTKDKWKVNTIPIVNLRRNWDYEVISKCIFDGEANEYNVEDEIPDDVNRKYVSICEDDIPDEVLLAFRFEKNEHHSVHMLNAKRCGLGVLKIMRGKLKDLEFMFAIEDFLNRGLQIFVYGFMTHRYLDPKILKKLKNDDELKFELMMVADLEIYEEIMSSI